MRKLRSVKLSAPRPKLQRMTSRISRQVRIRTMLDRTSFLVTRCARHNGCAGEHGSVGRFVVQREC
jgi:hypothetical protein